MEKFEISQETLRGLYIIMCGLGTDHSGAEVYSKAVPLMNKAHKEILEMGERAGFKMRGEDIK